MNTQRITEVRRALISVSDKKGILQFAQGLQELGIEIISTGGTARMLSEAGVPVIPVSNVTEFPEIMDGRVKTLNPKIHGGILGLRDRHASQAAEHGIGWIDLVVCNLYPFEAAIEDPEVSLDTALENIDIGGPTMIRAAAKNLRWTGVITSPFRYDEVLQELREQGGLVEETRKSLSADAFRHTAGYDALIQQYLTDEPFPRELTLTFRKHSDLRYGENPHQQAAAYRAVEPPADRDVPSILDADILHGKALSFNNIQDAAGALSALREFSRPACVVVKHASPCGIAEGDDISETAVRAFEADRLSAFGGIVAVNRTCTLEVAEFLRKVFFEIMIAPDFEPRALELLQQKQQLRILQTGQVHPPRKVLAAKHISGGMLLQESDTAEITPEGLRTVTQTVPTRQQTADMLFAWKALKYVKSNGILTARNCTTLGIGGGQVSRVDAVKTALRKTAEASGAVLASDAFFPFRDSIDEIAASGIKAVIQPGGSKRDGEVIEACNEHGIAMVFTGIRCFLH